MSDLARRRLLFALIIPVVLLLDQWSKAMILARPDLFNALGCLNDTRLCGEVKVPGPMDLTMVWNRGISFGTLEAEGWARWALFGLAGVISVVFMVWLTRAQRWLTMLSLALVIGGAIGNMIDRARFGAVVDFLNFSEIWFIWVFNVADAAITVGAILLFVDQYLVSREEAASARKADKGNAE